MTTMKSATPAHIVERNRCNAVASTGPQTDEGKAVARRNALKHGLCANPAAGVVEDCDQFRHLHDAVVERYQPRDVIEAGLIHRVAVSLWRLQRAAKIDAAISSISARSESPLRKQVQDWMDRITTQFWHLDYVEVKDKALVRQRIRDGLHVSGKSYHRLERRFLRYADKMRDQEMMTDGAGIVAMVRLIEYFVSVLDARANFCAIDAQLLAWLLGESAERLVPPHDSDDQRAVFFPDEKIWESRIDQLIGEARKRPKEHPLSDELRGFVATRIATLRGQSIVADDPYLIDQAADKRTASLLPNAAMMDRLIRYETHADRSLHRSLEMLAKMRGATVESISASITSPGPAGTTVEIHGQRTQWQPSALAEP